MPKPEDCLEQYGLIIKEVKKVESNYAEALKYWWDKWHRFVEFDTEEEMYAMIPQWIKNMVEFLEHTASLKGLNGKFNYEKGQFQTSTKTLNVTVGGNIEY